MYDSNKEHKTNKFAAHLAMKMTGVGQIGVGQVNDKAV